jgi:phosphonate metabolism protein PhnN/1,5-bisphosphokinase (PRPP-forming)
MTERTGGGGQGVLVLVVGRSGAGKDTLIQGARRRLEADPRFVFAERVITRPSGPHEPHATVSAAQFEALESRGAFLLSWAAHGHRYAIPRDTLTALEAGRIVVLNVSRTVIAAACNVWPDVRIVNVTASAAVCRERLLARGRETARAIEDRIARDVELALAGTPVDTIDNNGPAASGIALFAALLERYAASGHRPATVKRSPAAG